MPPRNAVGRKTAINTNVIAIRRRMGYVIQEGGLFLQPVTYPAVPKHKSRLRISVSAAHSEAELEFAVGVITRVLREEGICRA